MNITGKIIFNDNVEFTTIDVNSNKFLIYYRENNELIKYSLPLTLIKEFIYIDEKEIKRCPICDSPDILISDPIPEPKLISKPIPDLKPKPKLILNPIPEPINPIKPPKMENEDITYFDGINDPLDWECLNCGANKELFNTKPPKIILKFKPKKIKKVIKKVHDDKRDNGNLENLKLNAKRYRNISHWFKIPIELSKVISDIFTEVIPIFKYYEKEYYIYLEYLWYLDGIQHKQATSKHLIDDCRVCNNRYLRPPKHFNKTILKYKYPDMWNLCNGKYKWEIQNNYVILQIKWSKKEYYENYNKLKNGC